MEPVRNLTKHERIVLRSLALKGENNIFAISELEQIVYVTTLRSIRSLKRKKLVWLVKVGNRGPKSAQTHCLTPLGLLASIIFCDLWESVDIVLKNNLFISPFFIKYYDKFVEQGLEPAVKQAAYQES